jgi:hypothetical protein
LVCTRDTRFRALSSPNGVPLSTRAICHLAVLLPSEIFPTPSGPHRQRLSAGSRGG